MNKADDMRNFKCHKERAKKFAEICGDSFVDAMMDDIADLYDQKHDCKSFSKELRK